MEEQLDKISNEQELRDAIELIVSKISRIDRSEFEDDVLIREELGIDSLMAMEILARCERRFAIEIPESEMYEVQTVADFVAVVKRRFFETHGSDKTA